MGAGRVLGYYMNKLTPVRDGYTFDGWWTAKTGGTQVVATDVAMQDATYYAHWKVQTYSVFFHANGGTGGKTFTVANGKTLGQYIDKVTPENFGYILDGWYTAKTGGTKISASTIVNANVTYYAHWIDMDAMACVRSADGDADVVAIGALANYYGYAYGADGGEEKMLLSVFEDGKATAVVGGETVYRGALPLLVAPDGATLRVVLEGDTIFGLQQ